MGCCQSGPGVDVADAAKYMAELRQQYVGTGKILVLGCKDQNWPGKVSISGEIDQQLQESLSKALGVPMAKSDKYDIMYDSTWRDTKLTTGMTVMSMEKSYFPLGKRIIPVLDALAQHGWVANAGVNFGGVTSHTDDKGNKHYDVYSWPVYVFSQDTGSKFTAENFMLSVKDNNIPGKLIATGPAEVVSELTKRLTPRLQVKTPKVKVGFDGYDTAEKCDAVWANTEITSGMAMLSFSKPWFPKGQTVLTIFEEVYKLNWRLSSAPSFGGGGSTWPTFNFRKLAIPEDTPDLLFCAIKDQNMPGKVCFAGKDAQQAADRLAQALADIGQSPKVEKDEYDDDWDAVVRETHLTTGCAVFSFKLQYFPKGDAMKALLKAVNDLGYSLEGCPKFGGGDPPCSVGWPCFVFRKVPAKLQSALVCIKDDNIPGKVCVLGITPECEGGELFKGLQSLNGDGVTMGKDDYDATFDVCYRNTRITTGHSTFTWQKPYWPYGNTVEMITTVMHGKGWSIRGSPNFGDGMYQWPCMIFEKNAKE